MSANPFDLFAAAREELIREGFQPDFPPGTDAQLGQIEAQAAHLASQGVRDLRALLWSSIDNDTSRDLDQAEAAEQVGDGIRIFVAVADVDSLIGMNTPIDDHAKEQTTSVYTHIRTFPMLPEQLSTNLTSLNENVDRLAIVVEMLVAPDGTIAASDIYRAVVKNQAQLTYNGVGPWLEGSAPPPPKIDASKELAAQIQLQDQASRLLAGHRQKMGALDLDRVEAEPDIADGQVRGISVRRRNRASELIESFMVAANSVMARTLEAAGVSAIQRVVKTPERWPRIVELAQRYNDSLPAQPDSKALNEFLKRRHAADGDHYADISLAVVKLMGPGEYVLKRPNDPDPGHFALALNDYAHSTAPNRRFADTVTQRLIKSTFSKAPCPYTDAELESIARNCTLKEDAARKVERTMIKRIAAVALSKRIGETFTAVVTGVTPKGTFVRLVNPPAEGILMHPTGVDVGDKIQVRLVSTDPRRGYIDFVR